MEPSKSKEDRTAFIRRMKLALLFFLVTAMYGWILRLYPLVDFIPYPYRDILQAHSHVTFLGWGFLAMLALIRELFALDNAGWGRLDSVLYFTMAGALAGLLISFPLQGYKLYSIVFLSLFLLASYVYLYRMLKALPKENLSGKYVRAGIYFYYLSSVAIWALPVVILRFGKGAYYFDTIYFYLHFLYNGFFVLSLFGALHRYIERRTSIYPSWSWRMFYRLTVWSCVPAYALSLLWTETPEWLYGIGVLAAVTQLVSLLYLKPMTRQILRLNMHSIEGLTIMLVLLAYAFKVFFQFLSVFPGILTAVMAQKHNIVIAYLHLFTLGFMSLFLFFLAERVSGMKWSPAGLTLLITGILLSEVLLFTQGISNILRMGAIPHFQWLLLIVSTFMPLGIALLWKSLFGRNRQKHHL